ncbi:CHAT domain-containing protein [uncultured Winogradskyella sp.]|uniref:CHAT domain-containing protein n=1 Tax=uncultured Winogradskyella sp. TaxID=395353 RepID=UPI00260A2012|nr:CHAT domain-containing protein [uncultured Winogradskyella sp.]
MHKYFFAALLWCSVFLGYTQSNSLYLDTYEDYKLARDHCNDENYKEALVYVNKVKSHISKSKNPKSFDAFSTLVSISSIESNIYAGQKDYDKALSLIQGLRKDLKHLFDVFKADVFSLNGILIMQENSILIDAQRYDDALELLQNYKTYITNTYDLRDKNAFSSFETMTSLENLVLMNLTDKQSAFEVKRDELNKIKSMMDGNEDMIDFYFSEKADIIGHLANFNDSEEEYKKALKESITQSKDLLKEFKSYPYTNNKLRGELANNIFEFQEEFVNPFTKNYSASKLQLIKGKADLTELAKEIKNNKDLSEKDRNELIESIEETLIDIDESISNKELQEGRYQKVLNTEQKKEATSVTKDYGYYLNKFGELDVLMISTMYYQYLSKLNELLVEVNNSNFKEKDRASYFELIYYIHLNFYTVYSQLKDYNKALFHLDQAAIAYKMQPDGKISEDIINSFNMYYGSIYFQTKNYEKALQYIKRSVKNPTASTWSQFSMMASIYFELNNNEQALIWEKKYLEFLELQKENTGYAYSINFANHNLGKYYLASKQYDEANTHFKTALKGFSESTYNNPSKDYILGTLYADLGILYSELGLPQRAEDYMLKFAQTYSIPFFESLLNMDETSRLQINDAQAHSPNTLFYYLSQNNMHSDAILIMGYNYALMSKQLLLNTSETIRTNASVNEIPELKAINTKWKAIKNQLKDVNIANRDSLMDYARVYERELIIRGKASILELFENSKIEWQDIQQHITTGDAVIEFVSYNPYYFLQEQNNTEYGAFILLKDAKAPLFVPLCNEDQLNTILNKKRYEKADTKLVITEIYEQHSDELYDLVWQPLNEYLNTITTVYFSPSGILHNISFPALIDSTNSKRLSEEFNLIQLGSTKDIAKIETTHSFTKAALFGDIAYNYTKKTIDPLTPIRTNRANRGRDFRALPGTKKEIEQIEKLLKDNQIECLTYSQNKASEENLVKAMLKKPDIVHIGTHAFYLMPSTDDFEVTDMIGSTILTQDGDAMNRSGLALADANYYWKYGNKITQNREDGILTANEISTLNLSDVKLAVISACESGLGASNNNEGVFGIQRGLKMAGAQKLLVSLWKVDDTVTQEYMEDFYNNIFTNNLSIQEAFFKTQKNIKTKYPNPYYWGAFVLIQ